MTKYSPDERKKHSLQLDQKISRILRSFANPPFDADSSTESQLSEETVATALSAWRKRACYLPEGLLLDPAWGILLELLHAELGKRCVTLSGLCETSEEAMAATVRWLKALDGQGLICRRIDPHEPGAEIVELTPKASAALRSYFHDVVLQQ